jgi:glycosyltransferase involved in cell wall biosynthesis
MKISYAIPVCNEYKEIEYLLDYLLKHKKPKDEIVVQCDEGNTTSQVNKVLRNYEKTIKRINFPLNGDFATFKNNLKDHCSGDYIFQIDADEYPEEYLMQTLGWIITNNPADVFWVPRSNTVTGITQEHVNKWGWNVDGKGRINFPDYQCRLFRNIKRIKWKNKVHEVLTGHRSESQLPANDEFCIHHPKTIERQEKQNAFYETL